jgi:hypothetical protein
VKEDIEVLGRCEAHRCPVVIIPGSLASYESHDGIWFCYAHAPMLSDIVKEYREAHARGDWLEACGFQTQDDFVTFKQKIEADLAENGDRKMVYVAE